MQIIHEASVSIAEEQNYFYHEYLHESARLEITLDYIKRDFLFKAGVWRGEAALPPRRNPNRRWLAIGHSDFSTDITDIAHSRIRGVNGQMFVSNLNVPFRRSAMLEVFPLPLGLSNPTRETPLHEIYGDYTALSEVTSRVTPPRNVQEIEIYANFSVDTGPRYRKKLGRMCQEKSYIHMGELVQTPGGRRTYLEEMRKAGAVVCPRGNGRDTHRFYEALYVGAIPIVLRSSYSAAIGRYYQLPHISLDSWSDLENYREIRRQAFYLMSVKFDFAPITRGYWARKFNIS